MSVLSDLTIRKNILKGQLVPNGDVSRARHCAYEFRAARVVFGGTRAGDPTQCVRAIDLAAAGVTSAIIQPKAVAWVKAFERVKIPEDTVGLWVQTNSLSRRGLLLLNATLVEPGYEGCLAAHFVNMGTQSVALSGDTTIAKLVFFRLDGAAAELVKSASYAGYDNFLDQLAVGAEESFLRISQLMPELREEAARQLKEATDAAKDEIKAFQQTSLTKLGGGFLAGLLLAVAFAMWIFPWLRTTDYESTQRIKQIIREEFAAQAQSTGAAASRSTATGVAGAGGN